MKRGMSAEGAIILILIFGIVMLLMTILYRQLYEIGEEEFTQSECRASLQLTRAVDKVTNIMCLKVVENPIPLHCTRDFLTVTEDKVLRGDKDVSAGYNEQCPGENCLAEAVLAEELAQCWSTFMNGEIPVFQQVEEPVWHFFNDDNHARACFVCGEVTLKIGRDIAAFTGYLKTARMNNRSYYEYLAQNPRALCTQEIRELDVSCWDAMGSPIDRSLWALMFKGERNWPGLNQNEFKDGETYAITFVRQGMSTCREDDPQKVPTMTVQVIPAENIGDYCDMVMV